VHVRVGDLAPHKSEDCVGALGDDHNIVQHAWQYLLRGEQVP
jgi:hypothetical protein